MSDNFIRQWESTGAQWLNQTICLCVKFEAINMNKVPLTAGVVELETGRGEREKENGVKREPRRRWKPIYRFSESVQSLEGFQEKTRKC
jgi:hypothetical protein